MICDKIIHLLCYLYGLSPVTDLKRFLINSQTFQILQQLYPHLSNRSHTECLIIASEENNIEIALYIDEEILERMNANTHSLHDMSIVIEGFSHLLLTLQKAQIQVPITQFELEVQAEIDKFLVLHLYRRLFTEKSTASVWHDIFADVSFDSALDDHETDRYQRAHELAGIYCKQLRKFFLRPRRHTHLLSELKHFYRLSYCRKINYLEQIAA